MTNALDTAPNMRHGGPMLTDWVSASDAADMLGIDRSTLNEWAREGKITPIAKLPGRTGARLFARADVERLAQERSA